MYEFFKLCILCYSSSISVPSVSRTMFNTHQSNLAGSAVRTSAPPMCSTSSSGFNSFNRLSHSVANSTSQLQRYGGGNEQQGILWDPPQSIPDPSRVFLKQNKQVFFALIFSSVMRWVLWCSG